MLVRTFCHRFTFNLFPFLFTLKSFLFFSTKMDKLPVEAVASILEHLPQSDLVKAAQVCRKFREIIEKFDLIKQLIISESENESLAAPTRKYSKAIVKGYKPDVHQKVFEATGNHLKMLKFAQCTLNLIDIVKILHLSGKHKKHDLSSWSSFEIFDCSKRHNSIIFLRST